MKFVIAAVVLLAVTMGVQSSLVAGVPGIGLGLGINGLGINGLGLGINGLGINGLSVNGLGLGVNSLGLVNGLGLGINGLGVNGLAVNNLGLGVAGLGLAGRGALLSAPATVNIATNVLGASVAQQAAIASPLVGHGATYVAKTRGSLHNAPLAGHINSVASVNVAPAPGTW